MTCVFIDAQNDDIALTVAEMLGGQPVLFAIVSEQVLHRTPPDIALILLWDIHSNGLHLVFLLTTETRATRLFGLVRSILANRLIRLLWRERRHVRLVFRLLLRRSRLSSAPLPPCATPTEHDTCKKEADHRTEPNQNINTVDRLCSESSSTGNSVELQSSGALQVAAHQTASIIRGRLDLPPEVQRVVHKSLQRANELFSRRWTIDRNVVHPKWQ
mmetsp:Transcript_7258/g.15535  ORF Transcript_7258/g.15535 Transcript_7258/m.15535 type:complete len:216 (-) Transcript_7258:869-1516(-)